MMFVSIILNFVMYLIIINIINTSYGISKIRKHVSKNVFR